MASSFNTTLFSPEIVTNIASGFLLNGTFQDGRTFNGPGVLEFECGSYAYDTGRETAFLEPWLCFAAGILFTLYILNWTGRINAPNVPSVGQVVINCVTYNARIAPNAPNVGQVVINCVNYHSGIA